MYNHLFFVDHLCCLCFVFVMLSRLLIAAFWSPTGKGLTSWVLFVMFNCAFVTFPCGILVRCGTSLYRFPIFVAFLTLLKNTGEKRCGIWNVTCIHIRTQTLQSYCNLTFLYPGHIALVRFIELKSLSIGTDIVEGHWECKKHAVMLGCLCKALLRD